MSSLASLQQALGDALLQGSAEILADVRVPAPASARARLDIYCHGYLARLHETLRADYPALARCLGEPAFHALAMAYCVARPSRHPDLRHFGNGFPDFLATLGAQPARGWVVQLARLELTCSQAFDAADQAPLDANRLRDMLAGGVEDLGLQLHPSVKRLGLGWNVVALREQALQGQLATPRREATAHWLVWRQEQRIRIRRVEGQEARLLRRLEQGWSVNGLLRRFWREAASPAVGTQAFARQMDGWVRAGLLCLPAGDIAATNTR